MRTWEDYKSYVKASNEADGRMIEEIENVRDIVSVMIRRRQELGMSQRVLAEKCGIPQSSIARIETFKTTPKLDTLVKLMQALNMKLQISAATDIIQASVHSANLSTDEPMLVFLHQFLTKMCICNFQEPSGMP